MQSRMLDHVVPVWIWRMLQFSIAAAFIFAIYQFMTGDGSNRSRLIGWFAFGAGILGSALDAAMRLGLLTTQ